MRSNGVNGVEVSVETSLLICSARGLKQLVRTLRLLVFPSFENVYRWLEVDLFNHNLRTSTNAVAMKLAPFFSDSPSNACLYNYIDLTLGYCECE